jgi:hypothetical protein
MTQIQPLSSFFTPKFYLLGSSYIFKNERIFFFLVIHILWSHHNIAFHGKSFPAKRRLDQVADFKNTDGVISGDDFKENYNNVKEKQ